MLAGTLTDSASYHVIVLRTGSGAGHVPRQVLPGGFREIIVNERLFLFTETGSHPGMWSTRDTGAGAKRE